MTMMLHHLWEKRTALLARSLNYTPKQLQRRLVDWLSYPYSYPQLDPVLQCLIAYQYQQGYRGLLTPDLVQSRQNFQHSMAELIYKPTTLPVVQNLQLQLHSGSLRARHYHPMPNKPCPMIVFYHGGGFMLGDLDTHDEACRLLAKHSHCQILSIDYPLVPDVSAQHLIAVCEAIWCWVWQNQHQFNIMKNAIAIAGDSAGGNISTVISQRLSRQKIAPVAQLLIYPAVDFKSRYPSFFKYKEGLLLTESDVDSVTDHYVLQNHLALDDPLVSPIYGEFKQLAPAFIITAGHDVLHDEGEHYVQLLHHAGVKVKYKNYQHQAHGFINLTSISAQAKKDLVEIGQTFYKFLKTVI